MSDLIERHTAIDAILDLTDFASVIELFEYVEEHDLQDKRSGGIIDAIDAVLLLPSVQPEVLACGEGELTAQPEHKTGHWIVKQDHNGSTYGECSQCHSIQYAGHTPYCPTCGSRMIGGTS